MVATSALAARPWNHPQAHLGAVALSAPTRSTGRVTKGSFPLVRPDGSARRSAEDEDVLLARLQAGDETALTVLYRTHGGYVHGLVRRVTGSEAAADDVTQEVFTRLWVEPGRVDPTRGSIRSFLGVMAHRRAVDWVRAESRREARQVRAAHGGADALDDVADQAALRQRADRVRAALAALPDSQRQAVELAYFGSLTYREVAARLDIPEGTAKSRLRLALARLAELLSDEAVSR